MEIPTVMQEIQAGHGVGMAGAAQTIPLAKKPDASTIVRWCTLGIKAADGHRVKLEHVRIGRRFFTSGPAVERFILEMSDCYDSVHDRATALRAHMTAGCAHA